MLKQIGSKIGLAAIAVAAISTGGWWETTAVASDHDEAPLVKADSTVDLTDLYVFGSGDGKTTLIACWDGLNLENGDAPYSQGPFNEDALFAFNIDNNGDNEADVVIYWRYGSNANGDQGVQFEGVPGAGANISGAVETVFTDDNGTSYWTGTADDPFFFDAGGYLNTLQDGSLFDETDQLQFDGSDFLAGNNVKAAAVEIDTALLQDADDPGPIQVWITSAEK